MNRNKPPSIDSYIEGFPAEVRLLLEQVRATIRKAAPGAQETIKYAMPTFTLHGNLVYFAAFKDHIGLYPSPSGSATFEKRIAPYRHGKGTLRFPIGEPLPLSLITQVVKLRVKSNKEKARKKKG